MIAICIAVLCAILICVIWKLELLTRRVNRLENENDFLYEIIACRGGKEDGK